MPRLTLALIARVPAAGVADFQDYETRVLPLLAEHAGKLERRLRNADGTVELHVVSFDSHEALQRFRADPRREAAAPLLQRSGAAIEMHEVTDVV